MSMKNVLNNGISKENVDQYELLTPLLESAYKEMSELSKKKFDAPLNSYKVKVINRIIKPLKEILKSEAVVQFLDILDADDLPTNSDVVLILSQYIEATKLFYDKYYILNKNNGSWGWNIK